MKLFSQLTLSLMITYLRHAYREHICNELHVLKNWIFDTPCQHRLYTPLYSRLLKKISIGCHRNSRQ